MPGQIGKIPKEISDGVTDGRCSHLCYIAVDCEGQWSRRADSEIRYVKVGGISGWNVVQDALNELLMPKSMAWR